MFQYFFLLHWSCPLGNGSPDYLDSIYLVVAVVLLVVVIVVFGSILPIKKKILLCSPLSLYKVLSCLTMLNPSVIVTIDVQLKIT